jgi:hypothetical protein
VSTRSHPARLVWIWFASAIFCFAIMASALAVARSSNASPQSSHVAAKSYALIYGTVWGPDDHPVGGIPIKIHGSSSKKLKWDLVSDRNGEFAQRVPAGAQDYVIQADIKTPKGQPKPEITVHIDDDERKDVSIHLTK